jgi:hypothetical protein
MFLFINHIRFYVTIRKLNFKFTNLFDKSYKKLIFLFINLLKVQSFNFI